MTVRLLYFASVREMLRRSESTIQLPEHSTGDDLLRTLVHDHPALNNLLPYVRLAVNRTYVSSETHLHDGDEIVLIPPVSGG